MNENTKILLHLSLIYGIGPSAALKIIKKLFDDFYFNSKNAQIRNLQINLQDIYLFREYDFIHRFGLSGNISKIVYDGLRDRSLLDKELSLIDKHKIKIVSFLDTDYPENLKEIYLPPIILYCKGADFLNYPKRLAVVGARKANNYAKQVLDCFVPELVVNGWQIISGGAIGADSLAHEATLKSKGKTIAVLGSGLLNLYPAQNKNLFDRIIENNGTLISPFPLQTAPDRGNFPARNRIISGISQGCMVVQAAIKSGALITAHFALEQGRQVFAVPGPIDDELSLGCHEIIKHGAKVVSCVSDILEEFDSCVHFTSIPCDLVIEEKIDNQDISKVEAQLEIGDEQYYILRHLNNPVTIDELSTKTGLSLSELQEKLFDLQLENKIKQNFAGSWQRI
ncbi:MAG: DNA-processing protein DprA [bacterium]